MEANKHYVFLHFDTAIIPTARNLQNTVDAIQRAIDISLLPELSRHAVFQDVTGKCYLLNMSISCFSSRR
jgi:hypothetical protein